MRSVVMKGITKRFGDVLANDSVQFSTLSSEIHGLVGENGAGKSTLMKVLAGMYRADAGKIRIDRKRVNIVSPQTARQHGIAMVYQQFSLIDALTALENVLLGIEHGGFFLRDKGDVERAARELCEKFSFTFDLSNRVANLTTGEKQQLEILKALIRGAEMLILDEPTSLLAPPEVEPLLKMIRVLRSEGKIVVFITHKLEEVMELADRITVMRDGRVVAAGKRSLFTRDILAELVIGAKPRPREPRAGRKPSRRVSREKLRVERLCLAKDGREVLRGVTFSLPRGEILGVAGVVGNGQSELAEILAGIAAPTSGRIVIDGRVFARLTSAVARQAGIAHVPENGLERALVPQMTVAENAFLGRYKAPGQHHGTFLPPSDLNDAASHLIRRYGIKPSSPHLLMGDLSGGNQQKLVVAREMSWLPSIIVAAYPTRGLDLGTRLFLHEQFRNLRRKGAAILLISADLEEILELSDRALVLYEGEARGPFDLKELNKQRLGLLMTGSGSD